MESEKQVVIDLHKALGNLADVDYKKLWEDYLLLMALCVVDDDVRKDFESKPRDILAKYVPDIKIPEDAIIRIDRYGSQWTTARFSDGENEYVYDEGPFRVVENKYPGDDGTMLIEQDTEKYRRDEPGDVDIRVPLKKDCKKVIILPYFTFETDVVSKYSFEDSKEPEIILSCS